jgi:hypothetical protein
LPIAVSPVTTYLEIWHYASPELRQRTIALYDPVNAVIYSGSDGYPGSDTPELIVASLRPFVPITVKDFTAFAAEHRNFLLYSYGSPADWWPKRLLHDGSRLQLLVVDGPHNIYLVELNPSARD